MEDCAPWCRHLAVTVTESVAEDQLDASRCARPPASAGPVLSVPRWAGRPVASFSNLASMPSRQMVLSLRYWLMGKGHWEGTVRVV